MPRFSPLFFSLLVACSCSFYDQSAVLRIQLPEPPAHWLDAFPALEYRVVFPLPATGGQTERIVSEDDEMFAAVPKRFNLPILAYPIIPETTVELKPAGGIYPLDCEAGGGTVRLSWEQGACAEIVFRLSMQGIDCSCLNVARLRREMQERCAADPWNLDLLRICSLIALRDFRNTDIRLAVNSNLILDPGPGLWFLESPFRAPVRVMDGESLSLKQVPLGEHLLIDGLTGILFFLYIAEELVLLLPILPAPG